MMNGLNKEIIDKFNDIITQYKFDKKIIDELAITRIIDRMSDTFNVDYNTLEKLIKQESGEAFVEHDHPRDEDGKFADKDGGSVSGWKETTMKDVETKPEIKDKQKKIDRNVTNKVEDAIKELGIEDKIYDVAMQGSYEKGTDLPESGSDMDLFVVFKTNVSEEEKNQYGLEIGRKVLNKDFAESQGWTKNLA